MNRDLLFQHCKDTYGTTPEYLWERYPSYAVLRHRGNRKWYAVVMEIPFKRLGIMREGNVDVMNLKLGEAMVGSVRDERGIFPAYHMAKGAWVSVLLDGTVPDETILAFLDISHERTDTKRKIPK
ncbi:MAG: MmcQ/YjbR family DNA-binding protein [Clostridia bacterium]|nr:MmcQ/YjbR family DNA-binding protein [Clostridia bacterium]